MANVLWSDWSATIDRCEQAVDFGPVTALLLPDVLVMELSKPLANFEVLIGLEVLLIARLLLDGPGQLFTLDF